MCEAGTDVLCTIYMNCGHRDLRLGQHYRKINCEITTSVSKLLNLALRDCFFCEEGMSVLNLLSLVVHTLATEN